MKKGAIAVLGGLLAWAIIASVLNRAVRAVMPAYHTAELSFGFTLGMKIARLALGAVASIGGGYVASRLAKGMTIPVRILGLLLVAVFIPVHYGLWDKFPIWYHLTFLGSLLPLTLLGAKLHAADSELR
jgi:hypothetical protein